MVNVILAEDDTLVREGLKLLLAFDKNINVIGEAKNGVEVLNLIAEGTIPDILLTDINMPEMNGLSLVKSIKDTHPNIKVIMLSMVDCNKTIEQSFADGAFGYLLKTVNPDELIFAIKQVTRGNKYICSGLAIKLLERSMKSSNFHANANGPAVEFTSREMEVLTLISEGLTNTEMSEKLFISKRTIEGHRQSLIEKTGCKNTAALIKYAVLNGVIE